MLSNSQSLHNFLAGVKIEFKSISIIYVDFHVLRLIYKYIYISLGFVDVILSQL